MFRWHVSWNAGMGVAVALLVAGGALMVLGSSGSALWKTGFGIVLLAMAVYLVSRIAMIVRERRS